MKIKICFFLTFFLSMSIFSFSQDKVKFTAAGVTCSLCSSAIHSSLKNDKSILNVDPNLETQEWNVEYKKGEFKLENLQKRVEDAGFSVSKLWFNGELIYEKKRKKS